MCLLVSGICFTISVNAAVKEIHLQVCQQTEGEIYLFTLHERLTTDTNALRPLNAWLPNQICIFCHLERFASISDPEK